jgi:integral membrane protein (TIGR00529 family)
VLFEVLIWSGFVLSIVYVMYISRRSVWIGLSLGALVLGVTCMNMTDLPGVVWDTFTDTSILFLALAVALIPVLGGALEEGGLMDDLVKNLRIGKKAFLVFSPGLLALLPIPGGALLSAPLVDKSGEGVSPRRKAAINVWYRHAFVMVYPLGAILICTKMANINLYVGMLYVLPGSLLLLLLGYIFLIRKVEGKTEYRGSIDRRELFISLGVFLIAPLFHFSFTRICSHFFGHEYTEFNMVVAVAIGLAVCFFAGGLRPRHLKPIARKMKPWNFGLIIIGLFLFLNVFQASEAPEVIASVDIPRVVFLVLIGAVLGFVTGRISAPVAIMIPIYLARFGGTGLNSITFALMFLGVFMGYIISPVHPCLSVSLEYFKASYKELFKVMAIPTLLTILILFVAAVIVFQFGLV